MNTSTEYQEVRGFLDGIIENARNNGLVTTLLNRRRYLPEINQRDAPVQQVADACAINTPDSGDGGGLTSKWP